MSRKRCMAICGLGMLWTVSWIAAAPNNSEVEKLVRQLGADKMAQREAAHHALDAIGTSALEALKKAAASDDPEIRRRAEELIKGIEKRAETDLVLQPTKLKLNYKDITVGEAVRDLAKQTGFSINLISNSASVQQRKVTLQTGDLSFWEALDQFCAKAGLMQQPSGSVVNRQMAMDPVIPLPAPQGGLPIQVRSSRYSSVSMVRDGTIALMDGKMPNYPTHYAGAVRIRVIPTPKDAAVETGETVLTFEVWPEPKVQANDLTTVKIKPTADDKNQAVAAVVGDPNADKQQDQQLIVNGNIRLALPNRDPFEPAASSGSSVQQVSVRLKLPENPGKALPLLHGTVAGQVLTPVQPLITVDDPAQVLGKLFRGKDGTELRVQELTNRGNGEVQVTLELQTSLNTNPNAMVMMQAIQMNNRRGLGIRSASFGNLGQQQLVLHDTDGTAFPPGTLTQSQTNIVNGAASIRQTLTFRSPNANAQAKKLVYQASRLAVIEIPFELKNVALSEEGK